MPLSTTTLLNRLLARGKFRHVQVLLKLAELGSVLRTGEAIGITQSAVTQTLAYLEDLLETQLFERHARGVRPTAACLALLPVAHQLFAGLQEGAELLSARHVGGDVLRVVASQAGTHGVLRRAMPLFNRRHPTIQVHLREAEGDNLLLAVARGEVDVVVCRLPAVVPAGWSFEPLLDDRYAVICAADHPLRSKRRIGWTALARETWHLAPTGTAARLRFNELAARFPQPPIVHPLVTRVLLSTVSLLRSGEAISLLPLSIVQPWVEAGRLCVMPVTEPMPMQPVGLLRPSGAAAPAVRHFCEVAAEAMADVAADLPDGGPA